MAKPEREFSAVVGQKSMGTAGPEYIKKDLDKAFAMLDPNKTLPDGSPGGIGLDNMQQGAVNDEVIGNREIDDTQAPIGNIGFLSTLLNWIAYVLKSILGTSWRTTPAITLPQVKAHVDAPSPHTEHETKTGAQAKVDAHGDKKDNPHNVSAEQVGAIVSVDGVSNPGGNIDLVAGAGVDLTPDNVGKKITISAKNDSIIPGKHATTHGSGGSDPVTPASIGAATSKHATAHGSGGSDPITPASIGAETPAGAQAKVNTHEAKTTGVHGVGASEVESKTGAQAKANIAESNAKAYTDAYKPLKYYTGEVDIPTAPTDPPYYSSGKITPDFPGPYLINIFAYKGRVGSGTEDTWMAPPADISWNVSANDLTIFLEGQGARVKVTVIGFN